jgi:5-methylcytosine-specific restriction endonuclease McrA
LALFVEAQPSRESVWRAIILFGANSATYKFALGKSLLELAGAGATYVPLEDLAVPFAHHLTTHLQLADRQGTAGKSRFLEACRRHNAGEITADELRESTTLFGFANVLDAFHVVNGATQGAPFFIDERGSGRRGITLTDDLFRLAESDQFVSLPLEAEARWRLVETAWSLGVSAELLDVHHDAESDHLTVQSVDGSQRRRAGVTSARDALNGYQKGKCFYCFAPVSIAPDAADLAEVDHFFPHTLSRANLHLPGETRLDEVWNLVLACQACNRGVGGKSAWVPKKRYLTRLHTRNNYLIASHHPLRETLLRQTGTTEPARHRFLQEQDTRAIGRLLHRWAPAAEGDPAF